MESKEILPEIDRKIAKGIADLKFDKHAIFIQRLLIALVAAEEDIKEKTNLIDKLIKENQILMGENEELRQFKKRFIK